MKVEIFEDAVHEWRWRAVEANGRIIAVSGEGYVTLQGATRGFDNVINEFRGDVQVLARLTEHARERAVQYVEKYMPETLEPGGAEYEILADYDAEGAK